MELAKTPSRARHHVIEYPFLMPTVTSFSPEELKARFNPEGSLLRRQQLIMLDMLKELDRICRKYDIPYFLFWGTLLGAIRHDGFIPWDDDLDVAMLRKDYLRLMKVLPSELPDDIALQSNDTDSNYFYFLAKLRHKKSHLENEPFADAFKERGIFIDIFPLDQLLPWTHKLRFQSLAYNFYRTGNGNEKALKKIRALTRFNRHVPFPVLRFMSRLAGAKTLMCDYGIPFHKEHRLEDIFPLTTHVFEGMETFVPGNSDAVLRSLYGDYMRLPDDLDNIYHHAEGIIIEE
jgi:lipopolysaccharide cholinephosphotransferase